MPNYEVALPVDAEGQHPELSIQDRIGVDGTEKVIQLFGGDNFVGEVLSGTWTKNLTDGGMVGPPKIWVEGGSLKFTGKSDISGTERNINCHDISTVIIFVDDTVVNVHLKLNSLAVGTDQHSLSLYFIDTTGSNYWWVRLSVNNTTVWIDIAQYLNGVVTYHAQAIVLDNLECTFRLKWKQLGKGYTHVYVHDGAGDVDEETDELNESPFNISFPSNLFRPWYRFNSTETASRTAESNFIHVTYPNNPTTITYNSVNLGRLTGRCKILDTNGSIDENDWIELLCEDHKFVGDCILQNGLTRYKIIQRQQYGIEPYFWTGTEWSSDYGNISFVGSLSGALAYAFLSKIVTLSPEIVTAEIVFCDSSTEDEDHYIRFELTLKRGSLSAMFKPKTIFPMQTFSFNYASNERIGYAGDAETHGIGDLYLSQTENNTTLTDNWLAQFEPT